MKKLLIAALLAVPSLAHAQVEAPPDKGPVPVAAEGEKPTTAEDPSKEFNFKDHLAPFGSDSYKQLDNEGGPLGDNAMGPEKRPIEPGHEEEPMSVPFVYVLINFGILLVLLGWKAAPIARDMAAKRSDDIKAALDEAARLRAAAKGKLDEYNTKLKAAEAEIDQMITTMRESAEAERQRIIAAAEAQAVALKKDAEERIAAEIDRARHILQHEVVVAATSVAEKLLREKTTPTDQAGLVDNFIRGIA